MAIMNDGKLIPIDLQTIESIIHYLQTKGVA
jgi:hypothetical protein